MEFPLSTQTIRYIDIVSAMLMPVFQRMQYKSISKALLIGLDETFWKVRQKFRFGIGKQDEPPPEIKLISKQRNQLAPSYSLLLPNTDVCTTIQSPELRILLKNSD